MALYLLTRIFWVNLFAIISYALPVIDENEAALYLEKYGYLEESSDEENLATRDKEAVSIALRLFQNFQGLSETGSNWRVKELTYRISKYPSRFRDDAIVKNEVASASKIWSNVTTLNFKEKLTGQSNINIQFNVRHHGDGDAVDGPGNTLAHASFPQYGGDVHFNDEEIWTINETFGPPQDTRYAPDLCKDATIDTIARIQSGSTYVFKGDFYWKVLYNDIAKGYPRKISEDWDGLEGNLDASATWSSGKTYFFKGIYYWRFTNKNMDSGYPKLIKEGFKGMPDMLDAALVWGGNDKTYFFKGDKYWRFDLYSEPHVDKSYPLSITVWGHQLANGIDAAFKWENNVTYFFKGDQYYRFNDETREILVYDPPYPHSTATAWFGCR